MRALLLVLLTACGLLAAEPASPAGRLLEEIRAANTARAAAEGERAAWNAERERLEAIRSGVVAEAQRLAAEAEAAEKKAAALEADLRRLGSGSDLETVRALLTDLARDIRVRLAELARDLPPGAVAVPSEGGDFDAAARALDATERAASSVAVEVVTGRLAGTEIAVRLLRISGAAAWWAALDGGRGDGQGARAGTASMVNGVLTLEPVADPAPILRAIAQAEGRAPPSIALLPAPSSLSAAASATTPAKALP